MANIIHTYKDIDAVIDYNRNNKASISYMEQLKELHNKRVQDNMDREKQDLDIMYKAEWIHRGLMNKNWLHINI